MGNQDKIWTELQRGLEPFSGQLQRNLPLCEHSTMRVGGLADYYFTAYDLEQSKRVLAVAESLALPVFFKGYGSNIIFADEGYRGMILRLKTRGDGVRMAEAGEVETVKKLCAARGLDSELFSDGRDKAFMNWQKITSENLLVAEAGAELKACSFFAAERGLAGLSFACGIPGSVGGAVYMNAGAYGTTFEDCCLASEGLSQDGKEIRIVGPEQRFSYRRSVYRDNHALILRAYLVLAPSDSSAILAEVADFTQRRNDSQPLDEPSAGSVFKRPEGFFAGKLIMDAGLQGYRIGGAEVSRKHAGFIINRGGAQAADVLSLLRYVQEEVYKQFAVRLEAEWRVLDQWGRNLV